MAVLKKVEKSQCKETSISFYNCEGLNTYYEVAGEGEPLLLINGITADTRQWEPLVGHLKNSFKVISYDMRCAGKSDKPKENITISQLSREALEKFWS